MLLSCHAAVPPPAVAARRTSTLTVTVPPSAPLGDYLLISCADAGSAVTDSAGDQHLGDRRSRLRAVLGELLAVAPRVAQRLRRQNRVYDRTRERIGRRAANRAHQIGRIPGVVPVAIAKIVSPSPTP